VFGELVEEYGVGVAVVVLMLAFVLLVFHVWLGFNKVVEWWVAVLMVVYVLFGWWPFVGAYFAGFALRMLFVENDVWVGFAAMGIMLLIVVVEYLKEIRDRCG